MSENESELLAGTWTEPEEVEETVEEPVVEEPKPSRKAKTKTVTVRKVRGPRIIRSEGDFVNGNEYEVSEEVAEILLGLTGPHGGAYFSRV